MKARYWTIQSKNRTYYICLNHASYVLVNNKRVDIPFTYGPRSFTRLLDFQLPIDDLEVWCRFDKYSNFMQLYVGGELVPDQDNTQPDPHYAVKFWIAWSCFMVVLMIFALLLHFYG